MIGKDDMVDGATAATLQRARGLAAVVGNFDPLALVGQAAREAGGDARDLSILDLLSRECEEIEDGDKLFWRLYPTVRESVLAELQADDSIRQIAEDAKGLANDSFGSILASLSAGGSLLTADAAASGGVASLGALDSVLHYVGDTAQRRDVQAHIQREETEEALRFILPGELIGRDSELSTLGDFIFAPPFASGPRMPGYFLLTGNGGAGKSALLAEIARRELEKGAAGVPIIWLDLDRPMLAATDPVQLMLEFARQLALFWPDHRGQLDAFRDALVQDMGPDLRGESRTEQFLSIAFGHWREFLRDALPVRRPIALILDTFEEAILHGDWNADRLERWIDGLATEGELQCLRPVLSGRAFEAGWRERVRPRVVDEIHLEGLHPRAAQNLLAAFLRGRKVDPDRFSLEKLVGQFGGNPLVLKILAQYLADEGPDAEAALLAGDGAAGLQDELAQQFLYTRILSRIRTQSEDLVKLAFPGLALRRITADLIARVLAKPCKIDGIDDAKAEKLLGELSRQVWLIEPDNDPGVARHRRDLRRLMLKAIPAPRAKAVHDIHRRAADYYAKRRARELDDRAQWLEANYHRLMAGEPIAELADPETAKAFLDALGEDAETLPVKAAAQLKFAAGRLLAAAEAAALDETSQSEASDESARSAVKSGYRPVGADGIYRGNAVDLHAADAFIACDYHALIDMADAIFEWDFFRSSRKRKSEGDAFTESASWRVAIAALVMGESKLVGERLSQLLDRNLQFDRAMSSFANNSRGGASNADVLMALSRLLGNPGELELTTRAARNASLREIVSSDDLRRLQILGPNEDYRQIPVSMGLFRTLRTTTIWWLDGQFMNDLNVRGSFEIWKSTVHDARPPPLHHILSLSRQMFMSAPAKQARRLTEHCLLRELYLPIEKCAEQVPPQLLVEAAEKMGALAYVWPEELWGNAFDENLARDRKRWVATFVETADRAGCLGDLASILTDYAPAAPRIAPMIEAYELRLSSLEYEAPN